MIQTKRKLLSGVLAAALLLQTALPTAVFAAEPAAKTIVDFSALGQTEYTLSIGADDAAVGELLATLPKTITAKVEYIVTEEVVDSGKPETPPAGDTTVEGAVEAKPPLGDDSSKNDTQEPGDFLDSGVSNSTKRPKTATGSDADEQQPSDNEAALPESKLPDTSLVEKVVSEQVELAVTWESDKPQTTETAGVFTYTAVLTDTDKGRYDLAVGVSLPEITVTVAAPLAVMPRAGAVSVASASDLNNVLNTAIVDTTVTLAANFSGDALVATPNNGLNFTIDLNGQTFTRSGANITHNGSGTLTITDSAGSGKVEATDACLAAIINTGAGKLVITGGTVSSASVAI